MCSRKFLNFFCLCSMCCKAASDANNNTFPIQLMNEVSVLLEKKKICCNFPQKLSNPGFQKKKINIINMQFQFHVWIIFRDKWNCWGGSWAEVLLNKAPNLHYSSVTGFVCSPRMDTYISILIYDCCLLEMQL